MLDSYADRWAVVTGASSGIGAEFARRLAARGMHLVLCARRQELMEQLAADLHTRHGTRCEIIAADLSGADVPRAVLETIATRGIEVELLVNCAGFAVTGDPSSLETARLMDMVRVNVGALTELTYGVLPAMLERGHGGIINVASVAAFQPVAYMAAYAATKSYVLHLSEALWAECRDRGVTVTALCPGITRTEFFEVAGVAGWLRKYRSQTPEQVVKAALKGLEKRRQYVVSGWKNYWLSLGPRLATRRVVVTESMKYFRPKKARNKKEKESDPTPQS